MSLGKAIYSVGFWIRETGQAIDRLGCRLQGNYLFHEHRMFSLSLSSVLTDQSAPPALFYRIVVERSVRTRAVIYLFCIYPKIVPRSLADFTTLSSISSGHTPQQATKPKTLLSSAGPLSSLP
jgi:hypothetical protein